jgi:hypothetical protein
MTSAYSPALLLELMATGDQSGTWGTTTNTNLGTLLEQAITGVVSIAQGDATLTLSVANGATDQARNAVINLTGAMTAGRNVVVPTSNKLYLIKNSTTGGFATTIKTVAGTGVAIAAGTSQFVYCDGVNVVQGLVGTTYLAADANNNLALNNFLFGYATTATAAATTTLTVASAYWQFFTGVTTQTIALPGTSTLVLGQAWQIVNNSTGVVTINSSGANLVLALPAGTSAIIECIAVTGTTAASWNTIYGVTLAAVQTLTNKSLQSSTTRIIDNSDPTKQLAFNVAGITTATTRTVTLSDASGVMALDGAGVTTIASATSTLIGASVTQEIIISGTTTITSFDTVAASTIREGYFSGILTLTHSGTALILPGSANITTAANDRFRFMSLGSGNWICLDYTKADGTPVVAPASGGQTLVSTLTTSSGTTQTATGLATTYNQFLAVIEGVSNGNVALSINVSSDNGSTFDTAVALDASGNPHNAAVTIYAVGDTATKILGGFSPGAVGGVFAVKTSPTNAIRFTGGTFTGGTIKIYGVK